MRSTDTVITNTTRSLSVSSNRTALSVPTVSGDSSQPTYGIRRHYAAPDLTKSEIYLPPMVLTGMLARSPSEFVDCWHYERSTVGEETICGFSISNIGISLKARVSSPLKYGEEDYWMLPLGCVEDGVQLGIRLRQLGLQQFARGEPGALMGWQDSLVAGPRLDLHLLTKLPVVTTAWTNDRCLTVEQTLRALRKYAVNFKSLSGTAHFSNAWPSERFHDKDKVFFVVRSADRDFATIDVALSHSEPSHDRHATATDDSSFHCTILAIRWAEDSIPAQCGFIAAKHVEKLRRAQSQISDWDMDTSHLVGVQSRSAQWIS
jgi:hypothetical protein